MKTYTTSSGMVIELEPVPPLLLEDVRLKAMSTVEVPPIPTYKVELPDGSFADYEHDAKSIEDSLTPPQDKETWTKRQEALRTQQNIAANRVMDLFLAKGTRIDEVLLNEGEWRSLQEYFGIEIPTHPIAAKIHFLKTEALTTPEEINNLITAIMDASGIDKSILEAARNSFRNRLRQEQNTPVTIDGRVSSISEGQVVHEPEIP